jgi:hypothetical protein
LQPERALSPGPFTGASGRESGFGSLICVLCLGLKVTGGGAEWSKLFIPVDRHVEWASRMVRND